MQLDSHCKLEICNNIIICKADVKNYIYKSDCSMKSRPAGEFLEKGRKSHAVFLPLFLKVVEGEDVKDRSHFFPFTDAKAVSPTV